VSERKYYRQESRGEYYRDMQEGFGLDNDSLKTGSLMRIADACELMVKNHDQLVSERDRYKRWYESERQAREHADRRCNSLRGVITRMKKKAVQS